MESRGFGGSGKGAIPRLTVADAPVSRMYSSQYDPLRENEAIVSVRQIPPNARYAIYASAIVIVTSYSAAAVARSNQNAT